MGTTVLGQSGGLFASPRPGLDGRVFKEQNRVAVELGCRCWGVRSRESIRGKLGDGGLQVKVLLFGRRVALQTGRGGGGGRINHGSGDTLQGAHAPTGQRGHVLR